MTVSAKKVETNSGDLISSLPDEVLGQILSFLPTKLVSSTSLLSKRWTNVLLLVSNLDFQESLPLNYRGQLDYTFVNFVERTLVLLSDSPIKKFSFKWKSRTAQPHASYLISKALKLGVLELVLTTSIFPFGSTELVISKTLVKLSLTGGYYHKDTKIHTPGGVLFPALKILSLCSARFGGPESPEMYRCLFASPVLEEFNIFDDDPLLPCWMKQVSGSSIQRISICYRSRKVVHYSCFMIKTSNILYLDYSSYVAQDYVVQLDSLVEASLDLRLWKYYIFVPRSFLSSSKDYPKPADYWGDATKLIAAIRNVVTLHLSADSLEVLYFCCKSMPKFNKLVKLSFESHKERSWQVLPLVLEKSPNLETLVIKGLVHKITNECGDVCVCYNGKKKKTSCCLSSCQVKRLTVYGYEGSYREVKQMRHFVENLRCLEVVKVKVQVDQQDKYLPLTTDLMKLLPGASSKCKIQFI